ncbi:MAG: SDR family oxidoreductase [Candidatus Nanopelagicales bacterium]
MDLELEDRVFVVTGGSRGLGFSCAKELISQGARVVISGRDADRCAQAAAELDAERAIAFPSDMASPDAANQLAATAMARFGRLDGAVISVGGPPATTAISTTDAEWSESFSSIFLGALRVVQAVSNTIDPATPAPGGASIVAVLSSSVIRPIPGLSISNGLRPGLASALQDFARELGPRGIRINGLLPGRFATDRTFALDARSGSPDDVRKRNEESIPLGRYGEPDEFGKAAAFFLSPASSYITGAMIPIDGGLTT